MSRFTNVERCRKVLKRNHDFLIPCTSRFLLPSSFKETQSQELPEFMQFGLKESLVLKEKWGRDKWKREQILELWKKTLIYEGRRETWRSQKTIKLLILIAITFDVMSYTYENIKDGLGRLLKCPYFLLCRSFILWKSSRVRTVLFHQLLLLPCLD